MARWRAGLLAAGVCLALMSTNAEGQSTGGIRLEVDAREAPRKIFHSKTTMPAVAGKMRLFYPKWLPGEHGPTGPIADVAGLKIQGGGRTIPWRRAPSSRTPRLAAESVISCTLA